MHPALVALLKDLQKAALREIGIGEAAIWLEFEKSGEAWSHFRLMTSNFVSVGQQPGEDYETEILGVLPVLYRCRGHALSEISYAPTQAALTFDNGETVFINDVERMDDNLFIVRVKNAEGESDCIFDNVDNGSP